MPTFQFENGNQIFRYFQYDDYTQVVADRNELLLQYSGSRSYAVEEMPWHISFKIENARTTVEDGQTIYTRGKITKINLFDQDGNKLITIKGLDIRLTDYSASLQEDNLDDFYYEHVSAGGVRFIGSNDASGPQDSGDGDSISTGLGDDFVKARGGDDVIKDFGGSDDYRGGNGMDQVTYSLGPADNPYTMGIEANLAKNFIIGSDGNRDSVRSIEIVRGTTFDDIIKGDKRDNEFIGEAGDDVFNGRGGDDLVSYRYDASVGGTNGIVANLQTGRATDGWGDTDVLRSIEDVTGTNFNDVFTDDNGDNAFRGRGGNDQFYFGGGDDYVEGNSGADLFSFYGNNWDEDTIRDFDQSEGDRIDIQNLASFDDLRIRQTGGEDALIIWNGNRLTLREFDSNQLTAEDFGF